MKKIIYYIFSIIQYIIFFTAAILVYLSDKKMGVMRSLTFRNLVWNKMNLNKYLLILMIALLIIKIVTYPATKNTNLIILIIFNLMIIGFITFFNTITIFSYFIITLALCLILSLSLIKTFIK